MLKTTIFGEPTDRPPLLIAHGLFGSARNWGVIAKRLSETRQVIVPDMRNHGASDWSANHGYADLAQDLAKVISGIGNRADVLGHSMGGKAAMVLALSQPAAVRRLIVADIAPVAYTHTQAHLIEAMNAVDLSGISKRSDADGLLAAYVDTPGVRSFLLQSLDLKSKSWRFNLDALADNMNHIMSFPTVAGPFEGKTLFLSGADSDYVKSDDRGRIKALFPQARFAKIPDTGHWLHAEKPRDFEATVRAYLDAA